MFPIVISLLYINSVAPGRCGCNVELAIFKIVSEVNILSIFCENALRWMPQDLIDDQLTGFQVMAWCHQAPSHYLIKCWYSAMSQYDFTKPQCINTTCLTTHMNANKIMNNVWFSKTILRENNSPNHLFNFHFNAIWNIHIIMTLLSLSWESLQVKIVFIVKQAPGIISDLIDDLQTITVVNHHLTQCSLFINWPLKIYSNAI